MKPSKDGSTLMEQGQMPEVGQPREKQLPASLMGQRQFTRVKAKIVTALAIAGAIYHLLYIAHIFDWFDVNILILPHNSMSLAFLLTLAFLLLPMRKSEPRDKLPWYDILFILAGITGPLYNFFFWTVVAERMAWQNFYHFEYVFAFVTFILVLEAARRAIGLGLPLVALLFLLHMFFGQYLPGFLHVPATQIARAVDLLIYTTNGVYGIALTVASTIVFMFILFSQFLFNTGGGDFFIKLSIGALGHVRGGPAKVAVLASSVIGMFSGGTAVNIAATGVFTIPMMKRVGYTPEFSGAVETVASNGGQLMPPVMGIVAFVMAEWLRIPYWNVCVAAFVPVLLYYIAVFVMVDAEALRLGLQGLSRAECPSVWKTLRGGWFYLSPLIILLIFLAVLRYSPATSIFYTLVMFIVVITLRTIARLGTNKVRPDSKLLLSGVTTVAASLRGATIGLIQPGIACAAAGIIIGTLSVTQIGMRLSDAAVTVSGNNEMVLLLLAAGACFILGMGMSSLPAYIMVVIMVAPALLDFGVPPLAAHLFVFWFAIVSFITPPVAIGAYVAAGIAGGQPMATGWKAAKLGICTFIVPFLFVHNPVLLLRGSVGEIIPAVVSGIIGVILLAWGVAGHSFWRTNQLQRILFMAGGLAFMISGSTTDAIGVGLGVIALVWQVLAQRKRIKERR